MFQIPRIEFPEIKIVSLSVEEVKAMSDVDLLALLSGERKPEGMIPLPVQQVITSELLTRSISRGSRPHWSVTPSFWLLIIGTSAACIAAYPVIFSPPQPQQSFAVAVSPEKIIQPSASMPSSSQQQLSRSRQPIKDTAKR